MNQSQAYTCPLPLKNSFLPPSPSHSSTLSQNTGFGFPASYSKLPLAKVRGGGREELPQARGQGQWLRGATIHPRAGEAAERSYPTSKEQWQHGCRRAERSYSTFKIRRGGREEKPHVQGKRNPSKTVGVARGHQRADTLKP